MSELRAFQVTVTIENRYIRLTCNVRALDAADAKTQVEALLEAARMFTEPFVIDVEEGKSSNGTLLDRWIDYDGRRASVCFRNIDSERSEAFSAVGCLAVLRARIWAYRNGCGLLDVRVTK